MKVLLVIVSLILPLVSLFAQIKVGGKITDASDHNELMGASVRLLSVSDSSAIVEAITDEKGSFQMLNIPKGSYYIKVNYLGYTELFQPIEVKDADLQLGVLWLSKSAINLKDVEVVETQVRAEQKGDTTEYNAKAFKTNPDATAEDLAVKMTGITNEGGTIKAQGETVQKVLIDGKEFFGDDASAALKNVPADVVDRVQVFDRMNDQAAFTGFDDGNSQKALNIVTKNGMNNGVFGKVYAGYGYLADSRYSGGASINWFEKDRRISFIGMSNNVNQQNFSMEDVLGATGGSARTPRMGGVMRGGRGGGNWMQNSSAGNFMVGQQGGVSTTHAAGFSYSDLWGKKKNFKVNGSYFFNFADNVNATELTRQYFNAGDSTTIYRETNSTNNRNINHRVNLRMEYVIDSMNTLIFTPKFSYQQNRQNNLLEGQSSFSGGEILSSTSNRYSGLSTGFNGSGDLLYQHRFNKLYRTLSINIGTNINDRTGNTTQDAVNLFLLTVDSTLLEQEGSTENNSYKVNGNVTYTEPLGKNSMLMLSYEPSFTRSYSSRETYTPDSITDTYSEMDTLLTSRYTNEYMTQKGTVTYRLKGEQYNVALGTSFQYATLNGGTTFPISSKINKTFYNVLPNLRLDYRFKNKSSLRVFYRSSTNPPAIIQLQNVIDNSNPLLLSTGNPDLKQTFSHFVMTRYGLTNLKKGHSLFVFASYNYVKNYIASSTRIANEDTVLNNAVILRTGSQLSQPVNLDGNMNANLYLTYGLPITKIKSNVNFTSGFSFIRNPSLINKLRNLSNTFRINAGVTLGSNISEKIDFTISYFGNYNVVKNSLQVNSDNNFYSHNASLRFNWLFWKGFVFTTDVQNTLYAGIADGFNQNFFLWNAGLGYKFLKDRSLELRASVYDLLNQNTGINREITETYIEDIRTQVLKRYMLLTVTYTIRYKIQNKGL